MKRSTIIRGLMAKDVTQMFRNKFVAAMTLLSIVAYAGVFYIMPKTVDETFDIALHAPKEYRKLLEQVTEEEEGIEIKTFKSVEKLKEKVEDGDFNAGIVLPDDFAKTLLSEEKPKVRIYYPPEASKDMKRGIELILKESAFALTGERIPVDFDVKILGEDRAGEQIPPRDRVRPTFIILMLFMEMWGVANLITEETESKTMNAILITPAKASDVIVAKGVVGTLLGFSEAVVLALLLQVLKGDIAIILVTLLLGAMMVTGLAFIIGAFSKDLMSMAGYAVLAILLLIVPAIAVLFPGGASAWVKIFPSYYLVEAFDGIVTYGKNWVDFWQNLVVLLAFDVVVFMLGISLLRRRFQ
jgi:ABC-2 type transport system permease protein